MFFCIEKNNKNNKKNKKNNMSLMGTKLQKLWCFYHDLAIYLDNRYRPTNLSPLLIDVSSYLVFVFTHINKKADN